MDDERKVEVYIDLFKHWDTGYWTSVHALLVMESLLFAAFGMVLRPQVDGPPPVPLIMAVVGIVVALIWVFVLARKRTFVRAVENLLADDLPELYGGTGGTTSAQLGALKKEWDKCLVGRTSSSEFVKWVLPLALMLTWASAIIFLFIAPWSSVTGP